MTFKKIKAKQLSSEDSLNAWIGDVDAKSLTVGVSLTVLKTLTDNSRDLMAALMDAQEPSASAAVLNERRALFAAVLLGEKILRANGVKSKPDEHWLLDVLPARQGVA